MKLSVLVATYGRRPFFERCIEALLAQERLPDEIIIVTREGDTETEETAKKIVERAHPGVQFRHGSVSEPGVLAANRVGMALVTGDIVSFIDDDAAARPDWLRRIENWFAQEPKIGAVGGRDIQQRNHPKPEKEARAVGRIYWYGRIVGAHEKVFPKSAFVEHLKGVNMSFRTKLLPPFDELILGNAHHYEMDLCFAVRHQGYRVLHDGNLVVDHYVDAPRHLQGFQPGADATREFYIHHNRVYVMLKNLGHARGGVFLFYTFVLDGASDVYEVLAKKPGTSPEILGSMFRGKIAGLRDYVGSRLGRR